MFRFVVLTFHFSLVALLGVHCWRYPDQVLCFFVELVPVFALLGVPGWDHLWHSLCPHLEMVLVFPLLFVRCWEYPVQFLWFRSELGFVVDPPGCLAR